MSHPFRTSSVPTDNAVGDQVVSEEFRMPATPTKQIVKMTLDALRGKQPESEISRSIIEAGFDPKHAADTIASIREGYKAGTLSAVMGTRVHNDANDFYLMAFEQGRYAMRFTSPAWVLIRSILPILVGIAILAYLVWRFMF